VVPTAFCSQRCRGIRDDHGHLSIDQISDQGGQPVIMTLRPALLDHDIAPFDKARVRETAAKRRQNVLE
jgi:hypothetical protein